MKTEIADQVRDYIETAAAPISLVELAERRTAADGPARSGTSRGRAMPRRAVTAAIAIGVVAAAGATATAVTQLHADQTRPALPPGAAPHVSHHSYVRLTAAMVHHLQRASKAALASAGHVFETYADVDAGIPDGSGTIDIIFSGQNYNAVSWQPTSKIGTWTERVVNGQVYDYGELSPGQQPRWYHSTTETSGGQQVPDPRELLRALQPAAGFEVIGPQVIAGVPAQHLRASQVKGLAASLASLGLDAEPLTGLDVWVDSNGVIRQMAMTFSGHDQQGNYNVDKQTVEFLDIGKPETIAAPAHYTNQATHG